MKPDDDFENESFQQKLKKLERNKPIKVAVKDKDKWIKNLQKQIECLKERISYLEALNNALRRENSLVTTSSDFYQNLLMNKRMRMISFDDFEDDEE
jgi:hypothetical protein